MMLNKINSTIKVGITGQSGFIGTHLYNNLHLNKNIEIIPFQKEYFNNIDDLKIFADKCDVIIHLAGINRHDDSDFLYKKNIELANKLIESCKTKHKKHIIFSSSYQEDQNNLYGKSKQVCVELFKEWAKQYGYFTAMKIPNVFGPFCNPNYNSVIATFCSQLIDNKNPKIIIDKELDLIYIDKLISEIDKFIFLNQNQKHLSYKVQPEYKVKVSGILKVLEQFKKMYYMNGICPNIKDSFRLNLFNTFRSYIPLSHFPFIYKKHEDSRGAFIELFQGDSPGQSSYSTTVPGITRGEHFHTRKFERFSVIKGKASIKLRKINTDEVFEFKLDGNNPAFVDMPIWYTHNITNIGDEELITYFWINEQYNPADPDTFYEKV